MAPQARILAIDDQLYFRSFLEGLLSEVGFAVDTAATGPEALEILGGSVPFDLIVMDLVMPDTDGIELLRRFRQGWPGVAVIVVSGVGDVRSVVEAMREGAADYLLKPIDRDGLTQSITAVLNLPRIGVEPDRARDGSGDGRLVEQNLDLKGGLSLLERAVPLVRDADLDSACEGIIDLLCAAAGAMGGALWVRRESGGALVRQSSRSGSDDTEPLVDWLPESPELAQALEIGRPVLRPRGGGRGVDARTLFVPMVHDTRTLGMARLDAAEGTAFGAAEIDACATVAGIAAIAIANARPPVGPESRPMKKAIDGSGPSSDGPDADAELLRDPRTGLPSREFLEEVLETEIHRAHRCGRRLACLCVDVGGPPDDDSQIGPVRAALARTLRATDVLASEDARRFWVLVTETDALGGVVLKRRLAEQLGDVLSASEGGNGVALGVATYPVDGETRDALMRTALRRVDLERMSLIHELGLALDSPLASICDKLFERSRPMPAGFVLGAADLLIGEIACRPRDRGLVFLAPGADGPIFTDPLRSLSDLETATEVFLATDGDTVPSAPAVTAIGLPPGVGPDISWIVRFGEAPPYAMVAGATREDGTRPVFHTQDLVLVEQMTFRLRAEIGFGVKAG